MRQKLVTLDPTSFEHAKGMMNFSGWVRKQIHYAMDGYHIEDLITEIEHFRSLLERIRTNEIAWNGRSWMPIPPMHQSGDAK
jgi:hypothetical protein